MQRPSDGYRLNTNADGFDGRTLKDCDEIGLQSEHKPFTTESLNLQLKYAKSHLSNPSHDSTDVRHGYVSVLSESGKNRAQTDKLNVNSDPNALVSRMMNQNNHVPYYKRGTFDINSNRKAIGINSCNSNETLTPKGTVITNGSKHWQNLSKRMSLHAPRPPSMLQDESDSNDTDTLNSERNHPGVHYRASSRTDSASKCSSRSFNEDLYNESMPSECSVLGKKSSTMLLDSKASIQTKNVNETRCICTPSSSSWPQESEINCIMLVGLLIALFVSKVLRYLLSYFAWFQGQVLHIRNIFVGQNGSIWDFCNFDDTSRYSLRTKLLLLPVVGSCSLLYGLSSVLHTIIRCLLTQAPSSFIVLIQKRYLDA